MASNQIGIKFEVAFRKVKREADSGVAGLEAAVGGV